MIEVEAFSFTLGLRENAAPRENSCMEYLLFHRLKSLLQHFQVSNTEKNIPTPVIIYNKKNKHCYKNMRFKLRLNT